MSDSRISVGDLVVVVRGHECGLGLHFTVTGIVPSQGSGKCQVCGQPIASSMGELLAAPLWIQMWRLKRIDPLPLSELTDERETKKEVA